MESTAEYEITGIRSDVTQPYQTQRSPASLTLLRFACPIRLGRQSVSNGRRHLDKKKTARSFLTRPLCGFTV